MKSNWHQYSYGYLPDGSRVMLCVINDERVPLRSFPSVLICCKDGLYRLWRSGRSQVLARDYAWPGSAGNKTWDVEKTLQTYVPKVWGSQHGSSCVLRQIPTWLLHGKTANFARLLIAWFFSEQKSNLEASRNSEKTLRPDIRFAAAPLLRPFALTVIPNTDIVVRAINSGVLLSRLEYGLERIYVSEMAWIRAPKIESTLRALAHRFAERLILVKALSYGRLQQILRVNSVRAAEYQFIGYQLQQQYEEDFGYEKYYNTAPLEGIYRLRIGDIPRDLKMLWLHETPIEFDKWKGLDSACILNIEKQAIELRSKQEQKSSEILSEHLFKNKANL